MLTVRSPYAKKILKLLVYGSTKLIVVKLDSNEIQTAIT